MAGRGALRGFSAVLALSLLGACVRLIPESGTPAPSPLPPSQPAVANAMLAGVKRGPSIGSLRLTEATAGPALASFVESCPKLLARQDASGLTLKEDWREACVAATSWRYGDAPAFFETYFETARIADGAAFATGYYEPEIAGVRQKAVGYAVPVYAMPQDLIRGWPDDVPQADRTGRAPLGRYDAKGKFVPITSGARSRTGPWPARGWKSPGRRTRSNSSSSRSRARAASGRRTAA